MDPRKNPYTPNAGAMPVALVGRDDLIEDFGTLLYRMQRGMTAQSMIITGLRGVGKTVLLNRFCEVAEDEGWSVVEMEASDNDEDTFRAELAAQLMDVLLELEPRRKTWSDKFKRAFTALKSLSLTIDPEGSISAGLNLEPGTGVQRALSADLTKTFQAVGQAAKEKGTGVVILLDEIQFLGKAQMEGLIRALHKTVQKALPITLVGAGLPQIAELTGDAKSYSERLFVFPEIGNLGNGDAGNALRDPAGREEISFDDAAVATALAETGGYPYFIQEFGSKVWNFSDGPVISGDDAEAAVALYEEKLDSSFFRVRLERATGLERAYLRAMAELGPDPQKAADVARLLGRTSQQCAPTRAKLIGMGMLYAPEHGYAAFTVPHFDRYLRRAMPVLEVPPVRGRHRSNED